MDKNKLTGESKYTQNKMKNDREPLKNIFDEKLTVMENKILRVEETQI